jgi:PAS domain S-box-containing protein
MGRHVSLADRDKDELEYARQAAARSDRVARESEERLRLILESATDFAIITLDVQGRITGWNRGAERMFGYVDQEVYGRPGDILFIDEDRRRGDPVREMETALRQGRAANERWHLRKDGSYFWGSGTVVPLAADGEPPHGLLKIMRDRTAAKTAELELKASEARMQLAMDIADAATWDFDLVTGELYWSESHFRLLGYEPTPTGQADPHMWEQAILPDDLERVQAEWARAEKERDRFLSEHRIRRLDGAYLWARAAGRFFYDQGGRAIRRRVL